MPAGCWTAARATCTTPQAHEVALTSGEFDLLSIFVSHPGRVLSRDFLLEQTRGREAGPFDRTIDVQVGRLRKKLERDADDPQIIKSVRGAGYILVPTVTAAEPAMAARAARCPPGADTKRLLARSSLPIPTRCVPPTPAATSCSPTLRPPRCSATASTNWSA